MSRGYWSERTQRAVNGTIDVAFRGEVNDGAWRVSFEKAPHQFPVADVPVDKHVLRVVLEGLEIRGIARVGELSRLITGPAPCANQSRTKFEPMKPGRLSPKWSFRGALQRLQFRVLVENCSYSRS